MGLGILGSSAVFSLEGYLGGVRWKSVSPCGFCCVVLSKLGLVDCCREFVLLNWFTLYSSLAIVTRAEASL